MTSGPEHDVVILGLTITSSWGNGHAVTYRSLVKALSRAGGNVLFLERDKPWYAENRDLPSPPYGRTELYDAVGDLERRFRSAVEAAKLVVVGSYVPEGVRVGDWVLERASGVRAFYDIDTPVTLAKLARGEHEYLSPEQAAAYDLYLSFTGGPILSWLETELGVRRARALYCSVDPEDYRPLEEPQRWRLGYLGTYCEDRQPALERLLCEVARRRPADRFVVAGPQFPSSLGWPENVERIDHVAPADHARFYGQQQYCLNLTRSDMIRWGHAPSIRLFEAAACGCAIVTDRWPGLETVFEPGREILVADRTEDVLELLLKTDERARRDLGDAARARVLRDHTGARRAEELERLVAEVLGPSDRLSAGRAGPRRPGALDAQVPDSS